MKAKSQKINHYFPQSVRPLRRLELRAMNEKPINSL